MTLECLQALNRQTGGNWTRSSIVLYPALPLSVLESYHIGASYPNYQQERRNEVCLTEFVKCADAQTTTHVLILNMGTAGGWTIRTNCAVIAQTQKLRIILPPSIVLTVKDSTHILVLNVKTLPRSAVRSPMMTVPRVPTVRIMIVPAYLLVNVIWELKFHKNNIKD